MSSNEFWNMMGAIGTIGATSVALLATIGKWAKDWLLRPRFDYHIHLSNTSDSVVWSFGIFNKGRTPALNVKIKIGIIEFPDSSSDLNLDLGVVKSLRWRDEDKFEIVRIRSNTSTKWAFGFNVRPGNEFNRQDSEIELIITGDNFRGFKKRLKLIDSPRYNEAQLSVIE
jgi:hypothetical protein